MEQLFSALEIPEDGDEEETLEREGFSIQVKCPDYYEDIDPSLGYDFALEVYSTIKRSIEFPRAWAVLEGEIRRSLVRRFPYGVLYSEEPE